MLDILRVMYRLGAWANDWTAQAHSTPILFFQRTCYLSIKSESSYRLGSASKTCLCGMKICSVPTVTLHM